ncbi:hypothetical protein GCM10023155_18990 [Bremerella cremea]
MVMGTGPIDEAFVGKKEGSNQEIRGDFLESIADDSTVPRKKAAPNLGAAFILINGRFDNCRYFSTENL